MFPGRSQNFICFSFPSVTFHGYVLRSFICRASGRIRMTGHVSRTISKLHIFLFPFCYILQICPEILHLPCKGQDQMIGHLPELHYKFINDKKRCGYFRNAFRLPEKGNYLMILETTPDPTVLPPSRIANLKPSSQAIGVMRETSIVMWSPGITISTPSGSLMVPVTSVVLK